MFTWDFMASVATDNLTDWLYGQITGFLRNLFSAMGNMGTEIFELEWVQAIALFLSQLGWALHGMSLIVCALEFGIEHITGRANLQHTALGAIKGLLAASLFIILPVRFYVLSVSLQGRLSARITGYGTSIEDAGQQTITDLSSMESTADIAQTTLDSGFGVITSPTMLLFCIILMAYTVTKVFFTNLRRGGILLIQTTAESLYMSSIPRGYADGSIQWMKQVIGSCLTVFPRPTIPVTGLMVLKDHALLGLGLMFPVGEVPGVAGTLGLGTTTRANIMSAIYTAQTAASATRTITAAATPKQEMNITEGTEFHPPRIYAIQVDARPESLIAGLSGLLSKNSRRLFFTERGVAELKIRDMKALRLNRHPATEYRCVGCPGGYDAEWGIRAELPRTVFLQTGPEIMRHEVADRIYDNTGGGYMVGTLAVHLPDLDKTVWINCNDEGMTIIATDYAWNEDDSGNWERYEDVVMFKVNSRNDDPRSMWSPLPAIHEALAHTIQREIEYSSRLLSIPAKWLPETYRRGADPAYLKWAEEMEQSVEIGVNGLVVSSPSHWHQLRRKTDTQVKMVCTASPLSGDVKQNLQFARQVCRYAISEEMIPLYPHLLYT